MKVLGICCGRKNGNTEIMMKEAFRTIEQICGARCSLVRLQEAKINDCTGCESCIVNRHGGVKDFRCVHKNDSDHFWYIEQLAREADAVIVSAPSYFLKPPGILVRYLNRFHGSGDYEIVTAANPKVGATFTLGGSNWSNFTLPMTNKLTAEMVGSFSAVVDMCHFDHVPGVGAVVLREDVMARIRKLGENVARALLAKQGGEAPAYGGEPGVCPDCHGTLLERIGEDWYCPQCMNRATFALENGRVTVTFTAADRSVNRWSEQGDREHKAAIGREHRRAAENREFIAAQRQRYAAMDDAVKLPDLN